MNERIKKLALDAGLLNYIDNETPRRYFINGHADIEEVKEFAELIVQECVGVVENLSPGYTDYRNQIEDAFRGDCVGKIREHFGVEE